jgi:formylglycine-generating enzyme required for sulfatase activity
MNTPLKPARIFLSYVRKDEMKVVQLYHQLSAAGFKPWMDTQDILLGEQWRLGIKNAIRNSDFLLVCLSHHSFNRKGFLHREIQHAVDIWKERLDSEIFLIPVQLEEGELPESLRQFHWIDLFEKDGLSQLVRVIRIGTEKKIWIEPIIGMEFVWIPGGSFQMGQTETEKHILIQEVGEENYHQWYAVELPCHEVSVDGFWMGKTQVTNAQYRKWKAEHDSGGYQGYSLNEDNQPAVYVSWEDAKAFIQWLTEQHPPQSPLDKGEKRGKFRLPTEAEWEYACRAGTTTSRFWGDDPHKAYKYANVADKLFAQAFRALVKKSKKEFPNWTVHDFDDHFAVTSPVGSFQPNAFGLYDILGNIWEWCEDIYARDAYTKHQRNNPIYKGDGLDRVIRGGSWRRGPTSVRCAVRYHRGPTNRSGVVGFRLVMTAS